MKIFIEYRGSARHPWLCLLAETLDEKRQLEKLYLQGSGNDYAIDNSVEWQQQGHKLMFMLEVDRDVVLTPERRQSAEAAIDRDRRMT